MIGIIKKLFLWRIFSRVGLWKTLCCSRVVSSYSIKTKSKNVSNIWFGNTTLFITRLGMAFVLLLTKSAGCYFYCSTFQSRIGITQTKTSYHKHFFPYSSSIPLLDKVVEVFGPYLVDGVDGLSGDPKISAKSIWKISLSSSSLKIGWLYGVAAG